MDNEKSSYLAQRDENNKVINSQTTETGKLLMTIDNMFKNISDGPKERKDMIISKQEYEKYEKKFDFNDTLESAQKSIAQIKIITQVIINF